MPERMSLDSEQDKQMKINNNEPEEKTSKGLDMQKKEIKTEEELKQKLEKGVREGKLLKFEIEQEEIVLTLEQEQKKEKIKTSLEYGSVNEAIIKANNLSCEQEIVKQAAKEVFEKLLMETENQFIGGESEFNRAMEIKESFSLPQKFYKQVAKKAFTKEINDCFWDICDSRVMSIKEKFFLSDEFIKQVVKEAALSRLKNKYDHIKQAERLIQKFPLSKETVQEIAEEAFTDQLKNWRINFADQIRNSFSISQEFIESEQVQQIIKEKFILSLDNDLIDRAIEIKTKFSLSQEFINNNEESRHNIIRIITKEIKNNQIDAIAKIRKNFNFVFSHSELISIEQILKDFIDKKFLTGDCASVFPVLNLISEDSIKYIEIKNHIIQTIKKNIKKGFKYSLPILDFIDDFQLQAETLSEIDDILVEEIKNDYNYNRDCYFNDLIPLLNNKTTRKLFPLAFCKANELIFANLGKDQKLTRSFIEDMGKSYKHPKMVKKIIIKLLENKDLANILKINDTNLISEEIISDSEIKKELINAVVNCLLSNFYNRNQEGVAMLYGDDYDNHPIEYSIKVAELFNLSQEIFSNSVIRSEVKKVFIAYLIKGDTDKADYFKEKFNIVVTPQEIIASNSEVEALLLKIREIFPEFYDQAMKSVDMIITLFPLAKNSENIIEIIRNNPFLIDAVRENPRFGSKLLIKYSDFDETSQKNIQFMYNAKKEIMEKNPEIYPESLDFRIAMQEKLKTYNNNEAILFQIECLGIRKDLIKELVEKARMEIIEDNHGIDLQFNIYQVALREKMKKFKKDKNILANAEFSGIDTDKWLNYSKTEYFLLDSAESKLAFSETVATPISRIKETIASYAYRVKEVIKEYQKELQEHKIQVGNTDETSEMIKKMEDELAKAKEKGEEKKIKGLEKGIASYQEKLKKGKEIPLWDKIISDINGFDRLKSDVFKNYENIIKAEKEFAECASDKSCATMELMEAKRILAKAKEDLKEKFGLLEQRIEDFRNKFVSVLAPALGKDRSESLLQEIQQGLGEQFNHYDSDRSTLANLFSERSDKGKEKLDSRPMSIFVAARNPDIDLYQGNYSPCCICIDSAHMGSESTIADYNTDLGMQIVNIWDETKNEPVTAAWCWIGKDNNGNVALVVDNIESNTLYSANYPELLTEKLFDYLKDYAKAIGIKKVVQGKANNDLPVASQLVKMASDEGEYLKVGGYNRIAREEDDDDNEEEERRGGRNYFLEAEGIGTKIIWEQKEKQKEKRKKPEKPKVEFQNRELRSLTEEDMEDVLNLEEIIYANDYLNQGEELAEDIENGNGFDYSVVLTGEKEAGKKEIIGYAVGIEDETVEGKPCIYLEDIVVVSEAQGQGFGWEIIKKMIEKLKEKAAKEKKTILFDMHLRESSQNLIEKHKEDLERLGLKLVDEALVPGYYDEGEDALYQVYEIGKNE